MTKAVVMSVSKNSAGTVKVSGTVSTSGYITEGGYRIGGDFNSGKCTSDAMVYARSSCTTGTPPAADVNYPAMVSQSGSISGGTTNLITKQYSARLISETQIQCDGAVEWQVIEYN